MEEVDRGGVELEPRSQDVTSAAESMVFFLGLCSFLTCFMSFLQDIP